MGQSPQFREKKMQIRRTCTPVLQASKAFITAIKEGPDDMRLLQSVGVPQNSDRAQAHQIKHLRISLHLLVLEPSSGFAGRVTML